MKKIIETLINIFTRVTSTIFVVEIAYILLLIGKDATLHIHDIAGVLLIGFISAIAYLPILIFENLSKIKMLILQIIYFLIINISTIIIGFNMKWFSFQYTESVIAMEVVIILVYAIVMFISYKVDSNNIDKLNKILKDRNKE